VGWCGGSLREANGTDTDKRAGPSLDPPLPKGFGPVQSSPCNGVNHPTGHVTAPTKRKKRMETLQILFLIFDNPSTCLV